MNRNHCWGAGKLAQLVNLVSMRPWDSQNTHKNIWVCWDTITILVRGRERQEDLQRSLASYPSQPGLRERPCLTNEGVWGMTSEVALCPQHAGAHTCVGSPTSLMMIVPSIASFRSLRLLRRIEMTFCILSISCLRNMFIEFRWPIFIKRAFTWNKVALFKMLPSFKNTHTHTQNRSSFLFQMTSRVHKSFSSSGCVSLLDPMN